MTSVPNLLSTSILAVRRARESGLHCNKHFDSWSPNMTDLNCLFRAIESASLSVKCDLINRDATSWDVVRERSQSIFSSMISSIRKNWSLLNRVSTSVLSRKRSKGIKSGCFIFTDVRKLWEKVEVGGQISSYLPYRRYEDTSEPTIEGL